MATGKELKNAIKGKGLTIEAAAKVLEISRQTLHTHLNKATVDKDLVKKVKDKLDILLSEDKGEVKHEYSLAELLKVIVQNAETIVRNSRVMDSQQEMIYDYRQREKRAPDIKRSTKKASSSSDVKKALNSVK